MRRIDCVVPSISSRIEYVTSPPSTTSPSAVSTSTDWCPGEWPGVKEHGDAVEELRVAVQLDVRLSLEVHPFDEIVRLDGCVELCALHIGRGSREAPVAAAVIEVEMRVDHRCNRSELRPGPEQRPPLRIQRRRRVDHPRVDEDRAGRPLDRPAKDRPQRSLDGHVAEVQRPDGAQSASAGSRASTRLDRRSNQRFTAKNDALA